MLISHHKFNLAHTSSILPKSILNAAHLGVKVRVRRSKVGQDLFRIRGMYKKLKHYCTFMFLPLCVDSSYSFLGIMRFLHNEAQSINCNSLSKFSILLLQ